jgi:hypothetical protein
MFILYTPSSPNAGLLPTAVNEYVNGGMSVGEGVTDGV